MTYLTEEQYQDRKELLRGASTTMLWKNIDPDSVDGACKLTYQEEKSLYIWFIWRLLEDGEIKLARHGKFLLEASTSRSRFLKGHFLKLRMI